MKIIGLDLAVRTVGVAIKDGDFCIYDSYVSEEKDYDKLQMELASWVINKISPYLKEPTKLIVENVYVGLDPISALDAARTQGSVLYEYYRVTGQMGTIIGAMTARKSIGIIAWASKVEIQIEIVERLKLGIVSEDVKGDVLRERRGYELTKQRIKEQRKGASKVLRAKLTKEQAVAKRVMKNKFNSLSIEVAKQTGVDEHMADALVIVLGEEEKCQI